MNLVVIIDSLRAHGTQRFLARLAGGLVRRGHHLEVLSLNGAADPVLLAKLRGDGARVEVIGKARLLLGLGPLGLVRRLRARRDAVVLTLLPWADTLGRLAARRVGCTRVVTSIRARNVDKPAWQRALDRRTMPLARRVIFNSAEVVEWSKAHEGVHDDQVVVIPNGIEDMQDPWGRRRASLREALGLDDRDFVLGAVGRLYPQKDYPTLLRAFARLVETRGEDLKLFILGEGPERRRLESLARELEVDTLIHWAGRQDDPRDWYASFDAFLHTAAFEGMPNALMEAMSAGLPVVASDVDGCRELVEPGRTGWLCPPGQAGAFATAVLRILDDPAGAKAVGQAARQRILRDFSIPAMIDRYEAVLREVTG